MRAHWPAAGHAIRRPSIRRARRIQRRQSRRAPPPRSGRETASRQTGSRCWRQDGASLILLKAELSLRSEAISRRTQRRAGGDYFVAPLLAMTAWIKLRSEEHTSELQSLAYLVCRLLLEKKKKKKKNYKYNTY